MTTNLLPRNAENPFIVISSRLMRNPDLRAIEKVVLTTLIGLPEGWQPCAKHLAKLTKEGVYAIQRAIARLKEKGYLVCHSIRDKHGRFLEWAWTINEAPNLPDTDCNLDVYGHVVTFDRPVSASTNLRKVAKDKDKRTQELRVKLKPETPTIRGFYPDLDFPELDNYDRSNIDTSNIQKILEREAVFEKEDIKPQEENQKEAQQEIVVRSPNPAQEIVCTPANKEEDFWVNQQSEKLDQFSATAELANGKVEPACKKVEAACLKVEAASEWDLNELKNFQAKLIQYGAKSGKKNPSGWACTISKNMTRYGVPSPYWDEFKSGVAIGTCDRREWESEPGVPCEAVIRCLEEKFLAKPGTTPAEAAIQIGRVLENPRQMETLWQTIKNRVVFLRDEHRRLAEIGVENAALDPWMTPKPQASSEEAIAALQELQQRQILAFPQQEELSVRQIEAADRPDPEPEISEEECFSNIARLAAMCRGEKVGLEKIASAGDRVNFSSFSKEEEFGDIGW